MQKSQRPRDTDPPDLSGETVVVAVGPGDAGQRLDRVLAASASDLSRSRLKTLIEAGRVTRGGDTIVDPSYRVKPHDRFVISVPPAVPARPVAQAIPLEIVHEDEALIVINKPAGLVVHPAPGNPDRTLVNALIAHCGDSLAGIGGERRPGIVHRLDKQTSGLMVAAKTARAHESLVGQFAARSVERAYKAIVWGVPVPASARIEGNIGRSRRNRKKMAVLKSGGRPAATRYRVLQTFGDRAALVECRLETGRTHQIRVHMAERGHPVIGDALYGRARSGRRASLTPAMQTWLSNIDRHALHAYLLGFAHPETGKSLTFEGELPIFFSDLESSLNCP